MKKNTNAVLLLLTLFGIANHVQAQKNSGAPPGVVIVEIPQTQVSRAERPGRPVTPGGSMAKTGTCNDPFNFQTTVVQFTTAKFSFNLSNSEAAIARSLVEVSGPNNFYWSEIVTGTYTNRLYTGTFSGLNPSTSYQWLARVTCYNSNNAIIGQSTDATQNFITKTCNQVSNPTTTVSGNSVTVSWAGGAGISEQSLQRRLSGTTAWTPSALSFSTSRTITNLNNGVYNLQITGRCKSDLSPFPVYQLPTVAGPNFTIRPDAPSGLTVNAVGYTSARFSWNAVVGATSYNVSYKLFSATAWTALGSTTTTSYTFPVGMLQMGQSYDVRVQSVSGGVASALFARTATSPSFTTLSCTAPAQQPAAAIGFTRATLSWTGGSGLFNVQYKVYGTLNWTNVQVAGNSVTLTGLAMGTLYDWQIQSICNNSPIAGDVVNSPFVFVSGLRFTTLKASPPYPVTNANYGSVTSIRPNWFAAAYAVNYDLIYRVKGTTAWTAVNDIAGLYGPVIPGTPGTVFEVQVKTSCASSVDSYESPYSPITEMNIVTCGAVQSTSVSSITGTTASLNALFYIYGAGTAYDFRFKKTTDAAWTQFLNVPHVFVPDPLREQCFTCEPYYDMHGATWNIGGLTPGAQYQWQVRTNCGTGIYSAWVDRGLFSTLPPACPGVITSATVEFIEDGCAGIMGPYLNWTAVPGATQYELKKICGAGPSAFSTFWAQNPVPAGAGDVIGIRVSGCTGGTGPGAWRYVSITNHTTQVDDDPGYCGANWIYPLAVGANYNCTNNTVFRTTGTGVAIEETAPVTRKPDGEFAGKHGELQLAPNPAANQVVLSFNSPEAGQARVTITSLTGRQVHTGQIYLNKGANQRQLQLTGIAPGTYLLSMYFKNRRLNKTLIIGG